MRLKSIAITHEGNIRKNNEDNFFLCGVYKKIPEGNRFSCESDSAADTQLFSVCDGMGGQSFGEQASFIAVNALMHYQDSLDEQLTDYVEKTNAAICGEIKKRKARMGTTFTALSVKNGYARAYNIGDSRVYFYRAGNLTQISRDHSVVQQLVSMNAITQAQAKQSPDRHKLTQHFGIFPSEMQIEPFCAEPIAVQKNDVFLLCSDGLTDMLEDSVIQQQLSSCEDVKQIAERLLNLALEKGGKDNVTILTIQVIEDHAAKLQNAFTIAKSHMKTIFFAAALLLIGILLLLLFKQPQKSEPLNTEMITEAVKQTADNHAGLDTADDQNDYVFDGSDYSSIYQRRGQKKPAQD